MNGTSDLWLYDLNGRPPARLTFDNRGLMEDSAVFSPDGQRIAVATCKSRERTVRRPLPYTKAIVIAVITFAAWAIEVLRKVPKDGCLQLARCCKNE